MPLLRNGIVCPDDPWTRLADDDALPAPGNDKRQPILVSLPRFVSLIGNDHQGDSSHHSISGVWIEPADDIAQLQSCVEQAQLVVIEFPAFTDGRGYSHARTLSRQWHYSGEIRAVGDIRLDQILFMMRAGINAFEFNELPDGDHAAQALSRYRQNYQPSYALPFAG